MDLLRQAAANHLDKTGQVKKLMLPGNTRNSWVVYKIPLKYLYFNDKNGRINTVYKQYQAENGSLAPEPGNSLYNKIFEGFIYDSNVQALKDTLESIREKTQQEPGVVLPDGRVIDGNRRFTALRKIERESHIEQAFEAVILDLDTNKENDEKKIKELELDLQLGREERVSYDPIDRIFDVYNTVEVEKLMTVEEYKKASGAGNTKGINRDIRLAGLILRFIGIVSPPDNSVDKFYLARELKLDGPIEEIERVITKLKGSDKESITDATLVHLAIAKNNEENKDVTRNMREVKTNILKNEDLRRYFLDAVDSKVDVIMDVFSEQPISNGNDLKKVLRSSPEVERIVSSFQSSVDRLVHKGEKDSERKEALNELQEIRDDLGELNPDDFKVLTQEEFLDARDVLKEITDILHKLKQGLVE